MLFDNKYLNIDTGKFDSDKIQSIKGYALHNIIDDNEFGYGTMRHSYKPKPKKVVPKSVPNDNYFQEKLIEHERKKVARDVAQKAVDDEKARLKSMLHPVVYAQVLEEAEQRAARMTEERIYLGGHNHGQRVGNVMSNKWIPK